jgi:hypothetical protein
MVISLERAGHTTCWSHNLLVTQSAATSLPASSQSASGQRVMVEKKMHVQETDPARPAL